MRAAAAVIGALGVAAALFYIAATRSDAEQRTIWFTAIAAGVGVVALLIGAATVYLAIPGYRELVAQQDAQALPTMTMQMFNARTNDWDDVDHDSVVRRPHGQFQVRVVIGNRGTATVRGGMLNIQVPADTCEINVMGDDLGPPRHTRSITKGQSGELYAGRTTACWFTSAERDFDPPHNYLFVVRVRPRSGVPNGIFPVAAVLDSVTAPRLWKRVQVDTRSGARGDVRTESL